MKISEEYTFPEFTDLLDEAETNAVSGWDQGFVEDMKIKFQQYGLDMFLSDSQQRHLNRISRNESKNLTLKDRN